MQIQWIQPLLSGATGALAVTGAHETARKKLRKAPRMDVVGMRALKRTLKSAGLRPPRGKRLHRATLAGEVLSNGLYYGLASGLGSRRPLLRGTLFGALAGVGAVYLTPILGLGRREVRRSRATAWMAFSWYLLGGVVSGLTAQRFAARAS